MTLRDVRKKIRLIDDHGLSVLKDSFCFVMTLKVIIYEIFRHRNPGYHK